MRTPLAVFSAFLHKTLLGAALGAVLGLFVMGPAAQAANLLELNFWLSGPRYDGYIAKCDQALHTISDQFADKESTFWNSNLVITGFADVREVAFRPWSRGAVDSIPRRFCSAHAMLNDGKERQVHYSIVEDGGFAGYNSGVQWCVVGLDRNWAYNPSCRAAKP